jgi:UDP-N-acetylglucosamine transferase subunit ALG13
MRLFVSVGTRLEPFDRLIAIVDAAIEQLHIPVVGCCQYGTCRVRSKYLENLAWVSRDTFATELAESDAVVSHGGVGALRGAIRAGHVPLVLPRRLAQREVLNDHQTEVVRALEQRNLVRGFETASDLAALLQSLPNGERSARIPPPLDRDILDALSVEPSARRLARPRRLMLTLLAAAAPPLDAMLIELSKRA